MFSSNFMYPRQYIHIYMTGLPIYEGLMHTVVVYVYEWGEFCGV